MLNLKVIILIFLILFYLINNKNIKTNIYYSSCHESNHPMIKQVIEKYNFKYTNNLDIIDFYLTCNNDTIPLLKDVYVSRIYNSYIIGSKKMLWITLKNNIGLHKLKNIMPMTYILNDDIELLKQEYKTNKLYILKNEHQRQEGLKITNNLTEIINGNKNGYILVQEIINNPLLFREHKLNFRVYLLIICNNNNKQFYMHKGGMVGYSKKSWNQNTLNDFDMQVSSAHTSHSIYDGGNPIILSELKHYYDINDWNKIENGLLFIMTVI